MECLAYAPTARFPRLSPKCPSPSALPCPPPAPRLAALSADDRGGFKSVRQMMEPVIDEMQEEAAAAAAAAAAGEGGAGGAGAGDETLILPKAVRGPHPREVWGGLACRAAPVTSTSSHLSCVHTLT